MIRKIDPDRYKFVGENIKKYPNIKSFEFLPVTKGKCNLVVESYLQSFVFVLSSALVVMNPTKKESLRLLTVLGNTLCSSVYSSIAFRILMASKHCTANNLQNIYVRIGRKLKKDDKIPPLRFGKYKDFSKFEPINEDWEN